MDSQKHYETSATPTRYTSPDKFLQKNPGTMGRTLFFEAIRRGEVPHIRVGRRILVPENALDLMLAAQRAEQDPPSAH